MSKKRVEAPNVIVRPEHQSAPKDPHPAVIQAFEGLRGYNDNKTLRNVHTGDTDEFGHSKDDAILEAHLDGMRQRAMDFKTPSQTLEAVVEQQEKNYHLARAQRWPGQERWQGKDNEQSRLVRIMHCDTFIHILRRSGIRAGLNNPVVDEFIRDRQAAFPKENVKVIGSGGPRIWLNDWIAKMKFKTPDGKVREVSSGRIGVNAWLVPEPGTRAWELGVYEAKTVTTLQYPFGPEWSIMRFNEYNVPTQEKYRGWRSVLLALIIAGALTEEQAHEAFGQPVGMASQFYQEQLQKHREITRGIRLQ